MRHNIREVYDITKQDEPTMKEALFEMADQIACMRLSMERMANALEDQHAVISGLILRPTQKDIPSPRQSQ